MEKPKEVFIDKEFDKFQMMFLNFFSDEET
jgi:hypothetical protein